MPIPNKYVQTFLGKCAGIGLRRRQPNDLHIVFEILAEDDGNWFVSRNGFSSHWLPELQSQLEAALKWIHANCLPDGKYGWKFKENHESRID